jgi:hypothetical protein
MSTWLVGARHALASHVIGMPEAPCARWRIRPHRSSSKRSGRSSCRTGSSYALKHAAQVLASESKTLIRIVGIGASYIVMAPFLRALQKLSSHGSALSGCPALTACMGIDTVLRGGESPRSATIS